MTTETSTKGKATSDIIDRFKDFCRRRSSRAVSDTTLKRYGDIIDVLSRHHSLPLDSVDLDEIERVIIERTKRISQGKLSPATYNTEVAVLRRWCEFNGLDPAEREVRKVLKFKRLQEDDLKQSRRLNDSDVLKPEGVESVITHFRSLEWKALIAVMWDTGTRIGEICSLDYENVTRDQHGFILHITQSKTKRRSLRLITPDIGLKYFQPYYLSHRGKGALFQMRKGGRIEPEAVRKDLYRLGRKTERKLWPTVFRKSASTYWKKTHLLSDPAIRMRLGHAKNSRIFEQWRLQHGDDSQKRAELAALGVIQEIEVRTEPEKCWRCGIDIPDTERHCLNCHAPTSKQALQEDIQETSELRSELDTMKAAIGLFAEVLSQDPEIKKRIRALLDKGVTVYEKERTLSLEGQSP
jgi:integrase